MASALFWMGLLVSAAFWFVGDRLGDLLFPGDALSSFVFAFMFAVVGGAVTMLAVRLRALRSGKYEKSSWGVRKK